MLERTLVNLHSKSHGANEGPVELERRKKQRRHLEHELSKLRAHLAVSARVSFILLMIIIIINVHPIYSDEKLYARA